MLSMGDPTVISQKKKGFSRFFKKIYRFEMLCFYLIWFLKLLRFFFQIKNFNDKTADEQCWYMTKKPNQSLLRIKVVSREPHIDFDFDFKKKSKSEASNCTFLFKTLPFCGFGTFSNSPKFTDKLLLF